MNVLHFLGSIPALLGLVAADQQRPVSSITVEQTTVIRIPVRPHPRMLPMIEWREEKGPKCLPLAGLAGATLAGPDAVDFVTNDRQRFRARIDDDCTALDFYDGFYVQPKDERLCARRDEIRSRMGASCRIQAFRSLIPSFRR